MEHTRIEQAPLRDAGFTLVECLAVMSLLGIMLAIGVGPWNSYAGAKAHRGAAESLVSAMRNAQVAAVAERAVYRVDLVGARAAARVHRVEGGTEELRSTFDVQDAGIGFAGASFVDAEGAASASVWFYPRGSASAGSVRIVRRGSETNYVVTVEGLTGRVSYE